MNFYRYWMRNFHYTPLEIDKIPLIFLLDFMILESRIDAAIENHSGRKAFIEELL